MGVSSLGVGSSILTQDVLDQLREVDEGSLIRPINLNLANENDKITAFGVLDANMTNYSDSTDAIKSALLWDERSAEVTSGTSVSVSAISKTDIQDFTLNVSTLATKQIEQSGAFGAKTDVIDTSSGSFDIQVGTGTAISISYEAGTTLDEMKNLINKEAGDLVDATIVQINSGEFRLFLSSDETGNETGVDGAVGTNISIAGAGLDTKLTSDFNAAAIQAGTNASFTFNNQTISRASNKISDLISGLTITLKESGVSEVSIKQDRSSILSKFDSFVDKYNANMTELNKQTLSSTDAETRGIFSADSTIKSMKRALGDMIGAVGGGVGTMFDYGFSIDKDGSMSLSKTILEKAMDENSSNVQAFFSGGDFLKSDGSTVTLDGAFTELSTKIDGYTGRNNTLDQLKESMDANVKSLNERKDTATERLDAKYEIMKKQYAAYDLMISKFNSASSMFSQMVNAQYAAS